MTTKKRLFTSYCHASQMFPVQTAEAYLMIASSKSSARLRRPNMLVWSYTWTPRGEMGRLTNDLAVEVQAEHYGNRRGRRTAYSSTTRIPLTSVPMFICAASTDAVDHSSSYLEDDRKMADAYFTWAGHVSFTFKLLAPFFHAINAGYGSCDSWVHSCPSIEYDPWGVPLQDSWRSFKAGFTAAHSSPTAS